MSYEGDDQRELQRVLKELRRARVEITRLDLLIAHDRHAEVLLFGQYLEQAKKLVRELKIPGGFPRWAKTHLNLPRSTALRWIKEAKKPPEKKGETVLPSRPL
jgi:hypothetical protein